jgi:hypothetical protein
VRQHAATGNSAPDFRRSAGSSPITFPVLGDAVAVGSGLLDGPLPGSVDTEGRAPLLRLAGNPIRLSEYLAETITNRQFAGYDLARWDRYFLPSGLTSLADAPPLGSVEGIEDDNRSAILPGPAATIDGMPFFLSVKGVGSSVDPFSLRLLDAAYASELTDRPDVRERLHRASPGATGGVITGELWLRGSPYGGQGLPHATTALRVSERAHLTDLSGFRIAPVVKVAYLPEDVEDRLKSIHWYRRYPGRLVQELRLVPSNVRIYFHSRSTVGNDANQVFDLFRVDTAVRGHQFEVNFVRSGIALLTLFARTLRRSAAGDRVAGLDLEDVWLDKDAVLGPDGTAFFVDLEGIGEVVVEPGAVREKCEDQIFRSLYEFMFAYEQIERERARRFGDAGSRKRRFEAVVAEALRGDPVATARPTPRGLELRVRPSAGGEALSFAFPLVDT